MIHDLAVFFLCFNIHIIKSVIYILFQLINKFPNKTFGGVFVLIIFILIITHTTPCQILCQSDKMQQGRVAER